MSEKINSEDWLEILNPEKINESLDDIGGYKEIKELLLNYINLFDKINEIKQWKIKIMGKILLHGPPGTGKTTMVKAMARETKKKLVILNTTNIMSKYISETGKNLEKVFHEIKSQPNSIFFIDEFDSIAKTRESTGDHDEMKRIVNTLLTAFDKINLIEHRIITIAATNFELILDDAVWRRFDEIIYLNLPDAEQRGQILEILTRNIPPTVLHLNTSSLNLIKATENWSGADLQRLIARAVIDLLNNKYDKITEEVLLRLINEKKISPTSMRSYKPFFTMQKESMEKKLDRKSRFKELFDSEIGENKGK